MKTAVVTGPTRGLGREVAVGLARKGYRLIAAGRPGPGLDRTVASIKQAGAPVIPIALDLASLQSSREAAQSIEAKGLKVDVLVNNAGIGPTLRGITVDGFERHFGVNHLGHFNLTHHLRRSFKPGTRIVQITSSLHDADGIPFDRLTRRTRTITGLDEYKVSKLANILFVAELARRHPDWKAYAVHPGFLDTGMVPRWVRPFVAGRLLPPAQGAETPIWCADSPEVGAESGHYYARGARARPHAMAGDRSLARELWDRSESWCGVAPVNR